MLWWFAQTTLIVGALAVLVSLAGRSKRLGPEARHALWLVVMAKFLIPPLLVWPWPVPDAWPVAADPLPVEVVVEIPPVPVADLEPIPALLPIDRPIDLDPPMIAEAPIVVDLPMAPMIESANVQKTEILRSEIALPKVALPTLILAAWLIGSAAVLVGRGVRILRFHRHLRQAQPAPAWLLEQAEPIGERLGVSLPSIVVTSGVGSPLLWCLGRPRLVVPDSLLKTWDHDRWPGILAHELAHLARRDHWVVRLELMAEAVWWWNPLFWHVRGQVREQAEHACDARVVRDLPERRFAYAEALVEVCEHLSRSSTNPMPALGVVEPRASRSLEGRLLMILREPVPRRPSRWLVLVASSLLALALPAWTLGQQPPQDPAKPAEAAKTEAPAAPATPQDPAKSFIKPFNPTLHSLEEIKQATQERRASLKNLAVWSILASRQMAKGPDDEVFRERPAVVESDAPGRRRVQIQAADVLIDVDPIPGRVRQETARASRFDVIEARPGSAERFAWSRRLEFRSNSDLSSLVTDSAKTGAVPLRWRDVNDRVNEQANYHGAFSSRLFGTYTLPIDDSSKTTFSDYRVLDLLDFEWPDQWATNPGWSQINVTTEVIDGQATVRLAWIDGYIKGVSGVSWLAPELGFAVVRSEALKIYGDPDQPGPHDRRVVRKKASDFAQFGDLWLPGKVTVRDTLTSDGQPQNDKEHVFLLENYRVNLPPETLVGLLARPPIEQDAANGGFTTVPPAPAPGLVNRLEKAVRESPFGPPVAWSPVKETAKVPPVARVGNDLAEAKYDALKARLNQQKAEPSREPLEAMSAGVKTAQARADALAQAEALRNVKAAALLKPEAQLKLAQTVVARLAAMNKRGVVGQDEIAKANADLEVAQAEVAQAKANLAVADLTVEQARRGVDPSAKVPPTAPPSQPAAQARRDAMAAIVSKADAQKKRAASVVLRTQSLSKDRPGYVSQDDSLKAEASLVTANAQLARAQADLAQAEEVLAQAKLRPEPAPASASPPPSPRPGELPLKGKLAELQGAEMKLELAQSRLEIARKMTKGMGLSNNLNVPTEKEVEIAQAEVEQKKAEVDFARAQPRSEPAAAATVAVAIAGTLAELRDAVELAEAQLQGKRAELRVSEAKLDLARAQFERFKILLKRMAISQEEYARGEGELKLVEIELDQKKAEVAEFEIRLKQSKRRVEAEEVRLKRMVARTKIELDRALRLFQTTVTTSEKFEAIRDRYDDLMLQLDPNHVPTPTPVR